jgi:hypothetical protein
MLKTLSPGTFFAPAFGEIAIVGLAVWLSLLARKNPRKNADSAAALVCHMLPVEG